jgi:dimethylhistidine N-methyltransferase
MLEKTAQALVADYPKLAVTALACEYRAGLRVLRRVAPGPKLILWLGSNVGNFERRAAAEFLRAVRDASDDETRLIVGVDLRKDRGTLEAAYDDAAGVTARFNLNLLARINRDLGGHFDLAAFRHRAVWNEAAGRVEIYIDSTRGQTVAIDALDMRVAFGAGESIHTENSHKYSLEEIDELAAAAGLAVNGRWLDARRRFSLNRMRRARAPLSPG